MKKQLLLLIPMLLLTARSEAQLLWKISGNGATKASYIFGTHHVAPLSICDSIAGFDAAFGSCEQLYGELDMDKLSSQAGDMMKYMIMPKDTTYASLYSEEQKEVLDKVIKEYIGFGFEQLQMLKPMAIGSQLAVSMSQKIFNTNASTEQLDIHLQNRAKARSMPVFGLETIDFQCNMLFGAPIKEQADMLWSMAKDKDKSIKEAIALSNFYMNRDLDNLLKAMNESDTGSTPAYMDKIVYSRNRNWIEQLKGILPQKATFIVVGAGHLPGEQGVIELLRKQGYTVTAVK